MKEFLIWLKENHFHLYKDGTWFTTKERPYLNREPRKYYTDDELIKLYQNKK